MLSACGPDKKVYVAGCRVPYARASELNSGFSCDTRGCCCCLSSCNSSKCKSLRWACYALRWQALSRRDLPGYAIGGLAGGEDKESFCRCVSTAGTRRAALPLVPQHVEAVSSLAAMQCCPKLPSVACSFNQQFLLPE